METFPNGKLRDLVNFVARRPWWHLAMPRRYHTQEGYIPVDVHAAALGLVVYETEKTEVPGNAPMIASTLTMAGGCQYFWITRALCEALLATREPDGPIRETPWPFKAFTLLLPKGVLRTQQDGDMAWITVACAGRSPDGALDVAGDDALFLYGGSITESGAPQDHWSYLRADKSVDEAVGEQHYTALPVDSEAAARVADLMGWDAKDIIQSDVAVSGADVLKRMLRLAMNAAHYLASVPNAVEEAQRQTVKRARDDTPELWSPRWIGKHYARKEIVSGGPAGTHASPRMHWRRGHWRRQVVGEGRKDHRRMWIEPILVMAQEAKP